MITRGVYSATCSILRDDCSLNVDATIAYAVSSINNGLHGAIFFGSTGQSQLIDLNSKKNLISKAANHKLRKQFFFGTGCNSLNDTIVVYDRIRENTTKLINDKKRTIINRSLNETLNRTVITSITTMIVVVVLFFYGGIVLQSFAITLIIGICVGTYSSIYIASPIMFYFEEKYPIPEFIDEEV